MIPELGKYAATVLLAYGATLVLLAGLVISTLVVGRRVRAEMKRAEEERDA